MLGEYDDTRPEIIAQHLTWSRQANIGLWITSWWGPLSREDNTTRNVIMEHEDIGELKIAVHYETSNRAKGGVTGASSDMDYLCANYFDHPNYYLVDGRPVIFVYVTRMLQQEGILESILLSMRTAASKCGHDIFLVGDQVFESAPDANVVYDPFWYFDAVTNYDVYGSAGRPSPYAGFTAVDNYYAEQEAWRTRAHNSGCRYIPAVSPGYNDRGVRYASNHPPLSRKLTETSPEGSLFSYQLTKAKPLVDPLVDNLLVVNSFNEWHEDTQIEPVMGDRTNEPYNLTAGIYYEGYGELYLNILRESTLN
jgi:glycoprotein endo-alpha-1,2-mannosidase